MKQRPDNFIARVEAVKALAKSLSASQEQIGAAIGYTQAALSRLFNENEYHGGEALLSSIEQFLAILAAEQVVHVGHTINASASTGSGMLPTFLAALNRAHQRIEEQQEAAK